ncbi:LysR family transcriptional regulator [Pseudomonas sp. GX19020]|uniref:LysR family transcriptional regulator n=1 Tax=Pseudomonas sp. GX19020 TaxID=2942277 RepID=UPI00201A1892|nr:LysR family transcriptional regulator [Pseudomonas sp. GX19020]MCL4067973.1 LysR family transcriptional regulator [Pseudomonas sp. GX19020]
MDLRQLRYFVAVAEELHFRNAAQKLHISQPPLSQQIRQLEDYVGQALFNRDTKGVRLTPAGRRLLPHARRAIKAAEIAFGAVQRAEGETLRLGFVSSSSVLLPAILKGFREAWPETELRLTEANSVRQGEMLLEGELDVALIRGPWRAPGFVTEEVSVDRLVLVLAEDHPRVGDPTLRLADLAVEPFVFFSRDIGPGYFDAVMGACMTAGFSPEVSQVVGSTLTMVALVSAGCGYSLVPESVAAVTRGVAVLCPPDLTAVSTLHAVFPETAASSPAVMSIIDAIRDQAPGRALARTGSVSAGKPPGGSPGRAAQTHAAKLPAGII